MAEGYDFTLIREYLERRGYRYHHFKRVADDPTEIFVVFVHSRAPRLGFRVVDRKVSYDDFKYIQATAEEWL